MLTLNEHTFEKLFHEYYSFLCNYAFRYIADKQIVEDIVQRFFITLWEKNHLSVTSDTFLPYAYRSIKNSCINYYKAENCRNDLIAVLAQEWQQQLEYDGEEADDFIYKKEVQLALHKLPPKTKKVFLLKCISELTYKEIAEVSDISVNTVKYHLSEAFRIMKEELKELSFLFFLIFF